MNKSALIALMASLSALYGCNAEPDAVASGQFAHNGCLRCHAAGGEMSIAPPFASIAQRYAGNHDAAAALVESLKNGTHGKWAEYRGAAMPPQAQLSEDDAKALVRWILK